MLSQTVRRRTAIGTAATGLTSMLLPSVTSAASGDPAVTTTTTDPGAGGAEAPAATGWTVRQTGSDSSSYRGVTYGNGKFVAISTVGYAYVSTDGISWSSYDADTGAGLSQGTWYDITYGEPGGNPQYVAVATRGGVSAQITRAIYSSDGVNWSVGTTPNASVVWSGVAWGNGLYVAGANSGTGSVKIMTSTDGITWTGITQSGVFNAAGYGTPGGNPTYVVAGSQLYTSSDGSSWTQRTLSLGTGQNIQYITYAAGVFVAVGAAGAIFSSTDGSTWTDRSFGSQTWNGVTYGGGTFVAVGQDPDGNYVVATSTNGITWIYEASPAATLSQVWYSVTYGGGKFVAVGVANGAYVMTNP